MKKHLPKLENLDSLITFTDDGKVHCLGYLLHFDQHGTFDAEYGKVDVSKTQADTHNKLLDESVLTGLKSCKIGVGVPAPFYIGRTNNQRYSVRTFLGVEVSQPGSVRTSGRTVIFNTEDGKKFSGQRDTDSDAVYFVRCA